MKKVLLCCAILSGFFFKPLFAVNYYVALNGNDTNNGSLTTPWKTIQKGFDEAQPGDTVFIRQGSYNEQVFSQRDGTANDRIVICGYPGENPVLSGTSVSANNGLQITHAYISLINLEVSHWNDTGVWIYGNIGFINVINCKVHDCPYCLSLSDGVHDFLIDNCTMYNFGPSGTGGDGFGFSCEPNGTPCYNGMITNCKSYHGLSSLANNDGFALGHHDVSNITFHNCETYDVFDGFDISGHNILLDRCAAHDITNGDGAYKLWPDSVTLINCIGYNANSIVQLDYDGRQAVANIFNCTFHNAIGGGYTIWIENPNTNALNMYNTIVSGGDNRGLTFEMDVFSNYHGNNNIFQNDDTTRIISTNTTDYNLSDLQSGTWSTLTGQDINSFFLQSSNSLFVNDGNTPDLHLKQGSEAINAANALYAPADDFTGCFRTDGLPDIGAYEYGCSPQGWLLPEEKSPAYKIFPNPSNNFLTLATEYRTESILYCIQDMNGKNILKGTLKTNENQINIRELSRGTYLLIFESLQNNSSKFIKY